MHSSCLHCKYRTARILDKLIQNSLSIVVFAIRESCKRTHSYEVAVATHNRDSLQQMLALIAIHDNTTFSLQFPCTCVNIEHDDIHAKIHSCLLGRQACAQTVIEEDHHQGLVFAQVLILKTIILNLLSFGEGFLDVADVLYIDKTFHILILLLVTIYALIHIIVRSSLASAPSR